MRDKACKRGDLVIMAVVLLLAVAIATPYLFAPSRTLYCEVRMDGALQKRVKLAEGYQDDFLVGSNLVEIDGRRVRIKSAECPDQVCVRTGWISRGGQSVVCLPNRVVVKLFSGNDDVHGVDAVAQ